MSRRAHRPQRAVALLGRDVELRETALELGGSERQVRPAGSVLPRRWRRTDLVIAREARRSALRPPRALEAARISATEGSRQPANRQAWSAIVTTELTWHFYQSLTNDSCRTQGGLSAPRSDTDSQSRPGHLPGPLPVPQHHGACRGVLMSHKTH